MHTQTHTHTSEASSIPALFKHKGFQEIMKGLLEKIPLFLNSLLLQLPGSSPPLSHCAMKMVLWAPTCCLSLRKLPVTGPPDGSSRIKGKDPSNYQGREWAKDKEYKQGEVRKVRPYSLKASRCRHSGKSPFPQTSTNQTVSEKLNKNLPDRLTGKNQDGPAM